MTKARVESFWVENFKALRELQRVPIKPLTLIFGPNSSGKSSLIQALLLLKGIGTTANLSVEEVEVGEEKVRLPEFEHYVHGQQLDSLVTLGLQGTIEGTLPGREESTELRVSVELSYGLLEPRFGYDNWGARLCCVVLKVAIHDHVKCIFGHEQVFTETEEAEASPIEGEGFLLKALKLDQCPTPEDLKTCYYLLAERGEVLSPTSTSFSFSKELQVAQLPYVHCYAPTAGKAKDITDYCLPALELVDWALATAKGLLQELDAVRSLPALRSFPSREQRLRYFTSGEERGYRPTLSPWEEVINDSQLLTAVNKWIGPEGVSGMKTPYKLVPVPDLSTEDIRETFLKDEDIRRLHFSSNVDFRTARILLHDLRTGALLGHEDVGSGLGQIIPVLVAAVGGHGETIQTVSQPELHLHPKLQSDLMDLFIQAAEGSLVPFGQMSWDRHRTEFEIGFFRDAGMTEEQIAHGIAQEKFEREQRLEKMRRGESEWDGPRFVLETHSEAMLLRLMRRLRETAEGRLPPGFPGVKPEHVAILYVEPHEHGSVVHELELAEDGTLLDPWPDGFFSDGFEDRFA